MNVIGFTLRLSWTTTSVGTLHPVSFLLNVFLGPSWNNGDKTASRHDHTTFFCLSLLSNSKEGYKERLALNARLRSL
jgi:hypothetical protein